MSSSINTGEEARERVPIAQLEPSIQIDSCTILGKVALIWPYSSSQKAYGLLLAEPDFRLRRERGEVHVEFFGPSAKAVARSSVKIGDEILLHLVGVEWVKDSAIPSTPGRGVDWALRYGERLVLEISRNSQKLSAINIDHPTPTPEPQIPSQFPSSPTNTTGSKIQLNSESGSTVWSSPAFLKRSHLPYSTYLNTQYDPFQDERILEGARNKKIKFGRNSYEWKFADATTSPEIETELTVHDGTQSAISSAHIIQQDPIEPRETSSRIDYHFEGVEDVASSVIQSGSVVQGDALSQATDTGHVESSEDTIPDASIIQPESVEHGETLNHTGNTGHAGRAEDTAVYSSAIPSGTLEPDEALNQATDTGHVERVDDRTPALPVIQSGSIEHGEAVNDTGRAETVEDRTSIKPSIQSGSVAHAEPLNPIVDQGESVEGTGLPTAIIQLGSEDNGESSNLTKDQEEDLHQPRKAGASSEDVPLETTETHARFRDIGHVALHEDSNATFKPLHQKQDAEREGEESQGQIPDVEMTGCDVGHEDLPQALKPPKANIDLSWVSNEEGEADLNQGDDAHSKFRDKGSNWHTLDLEMTAYDMVEEGLRQDVEFPRNNINKSSISNREDIEDQDLHPNMADDSETEHPQQLQRISGQAASLRQDSSVYCDTFPNDSTLELLQRETEESSHSLEGKDGEELKPKLNDEIEQEKVEDGIRSSAPASRYSHAEPAVPTENSEVGMTMNQEVHNRFFTPPSADSSTKRAEDPEDPEDAGMTVNQEAPLNNRASTPAGGDTSTERAVYTRDTEDNAHSGIAAEHEFRALRPERYISPLESPQSTARPRSKAPYSFPALKGKSFTDAESSSVVCEDVRMVSPLLSPGPGPEDQYEDQTEITSEDNDVESDGDVSEDVPSVSSLRSGNYSDMEDQSEDQLLITSGDEIIMLSTGSDGPRENSKNSEDPETPISEEEDVSSSITDEIMQSDQNEESNGYFGWDGIAPSPPNPKTQDSSLLHTETDASQMNGSRHGAIASSESRNTESVEIADTEKNFSADEVTQGEEKALRNTIGRSTTIPGMHDGEPVVEGSFMQTEEDVPDGYNITCVSTADSVPNNKVDDETNPEATTSVLRQLSSSVSGISERHGNYTPARQDHETQFSKFPGKPTVEIIDLESDDEDDIAFASQFVKIEPAYPPASFASAEDLISGEKPIPSQEHGQERKDADEAIVGAPITGIKNNRLDVDYDWDRDIDHSTSPASLQEYDTGLDEENSLREQNLNLQHSDPGNSPQSLTSALEEAVYRDSRFNPISSDQLFTPSASQQQGSPALEPSVSMKIQAQKNELPTPQMTQVTTAPPEERPTLLASQQESLISESSVANNAQVHDHELPTPVLTDTSSPSFLRLAMPEQSPAPLAFQHGTDSSVLVTSQELDEELPPRSTQTSSTPPLRPTTPEQKHSAVEKIKAIKSLSTKRATSQELDEELPPRLTQTSSTPPLRPTTPEQKHSAVEKIKAIKSLSTKRALERKTIDRSSSSPWFTLKEPSQFTRVSDSDGDVESSYSSDQVSLIREDTLSDLPQPQVQNQPSPSGFRTCLSYFAPLSSLPSHFNTLTSVLVIVNSCTSITRSIHGPRDYTQSLFLTDPSSASSPPTLAQIFRPNKLAFPVVIQGDAILLRNFKVTSFQNRVGLLTTNSSAWAVFRKDTDVQVKGAPVEFGPEERGYARGLWTWWASVGTELGKRESRERPVVMIENKEVRAIQPSKYVIDDGKAKQPANAKDNASTRYHTTQQDASPSPKTRANARASFPKRSRPGNRTRSPRRREDSPSSKSGASARGNVLRRTPTRNGTEISGGLIRKELNSSPKTRANIRGIFPTKTPSKNRTRTSGQQEANSSPNNSDRHVLRDGTSYESTPEIKTSKPDVNYHELRDGTTYTDDLPRDAMSYGLSPENKTQRPGVTYHQLRDGTTYADDDGGGGSD